MNDFSRKALIHVVALGLWVLSGCGADDRSSLWHQTGGNAALFGQFQIFDGRTGQPLTSRQLVSQASKADVVLFGEEHSDVVCNALEAQLLATLAGQGRPMSLAMEFFEADTQTALDSYLMGRINESEFQKQTRQKKSYLISHRPMIEICKAGWIPVIAANAPWRLTRALRKSGKSYDEFLAGLEPADRAWLPRTSELLSGPYHDRFVKAMAEHEMPPTTQASSQPASQPTTSPTSQPDRAEQVLRAYRGQSLWDDSMAESVANHRARFPDRRVMLVVGGFHVAKEGGTQVKLRQARPNDTILTIVYHGTDKTPFEFDESDRGSGEIVIYGVKPPDDDTSQKPMPTTAPTTMPTTSSAPAS